MIIITIDYKVSDSEMNNNEVWQLINWLLVCIGWIFHLLAKHDFLKPKETKTGRLWQQWTKNDIEKKTNAYRQITWEIILQPGFTQINDYEDFDKNATSLWHTGQLIWQKQITCICFSQKTNTTLKATVK